MNPLNIFLNKNILHIKIIRGIIYLQRYFEMDAQSDINVKYRESRVGSLLYFHEQTNHIQNTVKWPLLQFNSVNPFFYFDNRKIA